MAQRNKLQLYAREMQDRTFYKHFKKVLTNAVTAGDRQTYDETWEYIKALVQLKRAGKIKVCGDGLIQATETVSCK